MAIYALVYDKNNKLHVIHAGYIGISSEGVLTICSVSNRVFHFEREMVKSIKVLTDEAGVAGIIAKRLSNVFGQKEGGE